MPQFTAPAFHRPAVLDENDEIVRPAVIRPGQIVNGEIVDVPSVCRWSMDYDEGSDTFTVSVPGMCQACKCSGRVLRNPPTKHELRQGTLVLGSPEYRRRKRDWINCPVCGDNPGNYFTAPDGWTEV